MAYVYVLKSRTSDWKYIGATRDLKSRFREHNRGSVRSTKAYKPFDLIYYEAYDNYALARKREEELKRHGQKKEELFERLGLLSH